MFFKSVGRAARHPELGKAKKKYYGVQSAYSCAALKTDGDTIKDSIGTVPIVVNLDLHTLYYRGSTIVGRLWLHFGHIYPQLSLNTLLV